MRRRTTIGAAMLAVLGLLVAVPMAQADVITDSDIVQLVGNEVGSGNGTLDLLLLTESAGGSGNSAGAFDADDACTDMPTGSGKTTATETYITSVEELRDFYVLNFPDGQGGSTVADIALFVDINQTAGTDLTLNTLDVVIDYDASFGDDRDTPALSDISSSLQNSTGTGFTGGTLVAWLDGAKTLPLNQQGGGWADCMIVLGIDPFDSSLDNTRILIQWSSSGHDDGGESIFLSGTYIPEPLTLSLLGVGAVVLILHRRRRT